MLGERGSGMTTIYSGWMKLGCQHQAVKKKLTVIIVWHVAEPSHLHVDAGRSKNDLRRGSISGMKGNMPQPHQDPETEVASRCQ